MFIFSSVSGSGSSLGASGSGWDQDSSASPLKSDHPPFSKSRGSEGADSSLDTTGSMDLEAVTSPMLNGGGMPGRNSPTPDIESLRIDEEDEEVDVVDRSLPKDTSPVGGRKEANGEW